MTPFWNPTTNYKIRIFILSFLLLAYGKCTTLMFWLDKNKKKPLWPLFMDGVQLPQG